MNYQAEIQKMSDLRKELYAEAGEVSLSNPDQAKKLWAAADALVVAMRNIQAAEPAYEAPKFESNPFDALGM